MQCTAATTVIRDARDDDWWDLVGLIAACWAEYPGLVMDVDGEEPWLRAPATAFAGRGGRLWVVEAGGRVIGCAGMCPAATAGGVELKSLYVARFARRDGLGRRLLALVEAEAGRRAAAFIELWSDSRFLDAHRFYRRHGYRQTDGVRALHDKSNTIEWQFRREGGAPLSANP